MNGSNGHKGPSGAAAAAAGGTLVGQPFTILTVGVPMNMTLTCNCEAGRDAGERPVLAIVLSAGVVCPSCRKQYGAFFNPQNGQIQMSIVAPSAEQLAEQLAAEKATEQVPS